MRAPNSLVRRRADWLLPPGYTFLADHGHRVSHPARYPDHNGATLIYLQGHRPCQRLLLSLRKGGPSWKLLDSWGNPHVPGTVRVLP